MQMYPLVQGCFSSKGVHWMSYSGGPVVVLMIVLVLLEFFGRMVLMGSFTRMGWFPLYFS